MNMDNDLVVHTRLVDRPDSEQLDPFFLETPLEWRNLEALLKASYKVPQKRIDVRYIDEDDDLIIISSQSELNEAVRLSQKSQKPLILQIRSMEPHTTPERSKASAPPQEDEKIMMDAAPEEEISAKTTSLREDTLKPFMVPGALSGANVVAIEIPDSAGEGQIANECEVETEHGQGTEAAEPAETLETGEVAPKLRRDEETGYWIVRKLKKNFIASHLKKRQDW
ncbi:uncharacterized protein LOC112572565 [Pomacea canaliculata]|uniref:uncharacterized protein LOC112572565 n=1 Tax=Pomacea canaliculata TaxID=400727 RepID=UPI000D731C45|nr:uncharacterized protein LOC112572565 [Pomacea canaliculata]